MAGVLSGKIQDGVDRQIQHRTLDKFAALGAEHRLRLGVCVEQKAIDQRRQIFATRGGDFKTSLDRVGRGGHVTGKSRKTKLEKKEQGSEPCSKIVSTLNFLENLDLILIVEATLLVRVRAPPETWTTKLEPLGQPEIELVDHLFRLVTIFGNLCSKFQHSAK